MTTKPALQEILRGDFLRGEKTKQTNKQTKQNNNKNPKDQKQQRLERTREHHQKLQLYRQHNGNKFISFTTHSKRHWTKCSNQKT